MRSTFHWLFQSLHFTRCNQLTPSVQTAHKASTDGDLGTSSIALWCLSESVYVIQHGMLWLDKLQFSKLKKKYCFHSNLVYAKVLKIRTGRLLPTLASASTFPELLSHIGNLEVTTCYFLELNSSNLNSRLCAWLWLSEKHTWNYNCTMCGWTGKLGWHPEYL